MQQKWDSEEVQMKTCRNCGRVNSDTAQHCVQCGNLLQQQSDGVSTQNNSNSIPKKNSGLFRNAGAKLKMLALIFFIIHIVIGVAGGVTCFIIGTNSYDGYIFVIIGLVAIFVSPLIGWLNAIILYAFGELCENVNDIRNQRR